MPWNQQDKSFKTLLAKRVTSSNKAYYEEVGDQTLNFNFNEIWMDPIALDPNVSIASGVVEQRTLLTLVEDNSVASQQCYYASALGERLKDWVGDKYGSSYAVRLYQSNGSEIFSTDNSQWIFDYQTGIFTFNGSTSGFSKPFKITGFRYVGSKGKIKAESGINSDAGGLSVNLTYTDRMEIIYHTLTPSEIAAKQIHLPREGVNGVNSYTVTPAGGVTQMFGTDYTVNGDSENGSTLSWMGMGLDGVVEAGEVLIITYKVATVYTSAA